MQTSYIEYLETRGSNPHSLDPKSTALPVKLVSKNYFKVVVWVCNTFSQ